MSPGMYLILFTLMTTQVSRLYSSRSLKLSFWVTSLIHWYRAIGKLKKIVRRLLFWIQYISSSDLLFHGLYIYRSLLEGVAILFGISLYVVQHEVTWPLYFHVDVISFLVFHLISYEFIQKVQTVAISMEIIT